MRDPRNWRDLLPLLSGLPLLPCGTVEPGDGGKVPINHKTGRRLTGWPTARFTPEQIAAMNGVVRCVGMRTGADADGILGLDIDGRTAIDWCLAHDCDPELVESWLIRRNTAADRLKVTFYIPEELWPLLGNVHCHKVTKEKSDTEKGEQVEVFFGTGQIIVLGDHMDSGGQYTWDATPQEITEIPPEWWGLVMQIVEGDPTARGEKRKPSDTTAGWHTLSNCPICGRDKHQACRGNADRDAVLCFHGGNFHPPKGLAKGQTIKGRDGQRWAFCGTGRHHGEFSTFRIDRPRRDEIQFRGEPSPLPSSKPNPATDPPGPKAAAPGPSPGFTKRPDTQARWGKVHIGLQRRLSFFHRCIRALVATERNSLRRLARVRHAHAALDLKTAINQKEIGQLILEQIDERTGNRFAALSAADRQAMPIPTVEWEIPDCIPRRDLTIIGGRAKVGKTRLANALVAALLKRRDFLGFGEPPAGRRVILVTDDQGDGDTAQMLQQLGIWDHPDLLWSRRFRVTERNIDLLLEAIAANPGAIVILDSLRSITRSTAFGENDPEMGSLIYDLKQQIVDAGGTLILIHHCNKSNDSTGTEALSGHNAIAGAANTIITLHYLAKGPRLAKDSPDRRLVREARSGPPADLVVSLAADSGEFSRLGDYEAITAEDDERAAAGGSPDDLIRKEAPDVKEALRFLQALHQGNRFDKPPGLLDLCKSIKAVATDAQRMADLDPKDLTIYKRIGRSLGRLDGVVLTERQPTKGQGFFMTYRLTDEGAALVAEIFDL
jgi:hypothetical protein